MRTPNNMSSETRASYFNFPKEALTQIKGEPTNATLTILKREIYANAMANETTLGCGTLGYLGLIMPDADFASKQTVPTPFNKPNPNDVDADDDSVEHQHAARQLRDYITMETKLKAQIIAAIDSEFLAAIEDPELGFGRITSKRMLQHLIDEYGNITSDDIRENIKILNSPWNIDQPIRKLWERIKECQRLSVAGNEPISDRMAMFAALTVLDNTGVFGTYTTNWRMANPIQGNWTLEAFREYFNHADKDRMKSLTTKEAGFHSANAAKVSETTTKQTNKASDHFTDPKSGRKIYYCWSHGATTNASHTSATCNRPKEGHIKEATWFDMQGGCCEFKIGKNRIEKKKTTTAANATNATAATVTTTADE
jgi:hypothetical protein